MLNRNHISGMHRAMTLGTLKILTPSVQFLKSTLNQNQGGVSFYGVYYKQQEAVILCDGGEYSPCIINIPKSKTSVL